MVTYKKLGLKMTRGNAGEWHITGKNTSYTGKGNKGEVMAQFLAQTVEVVFKNGYWQWSN